MHLKIPCALRLHTRCSFRSPPSWFALFVSQCIAISPTLRTSTLPTYAPRIKIHCPVRLSSRIATKIHCALRFCTSRTANQARLTRSVSVQETAIAGPLLLKGVHCLVVFAQKRPSMGRFRLDTSIAGPLSLRSGHICAVFV